MITLRPHQVKAVEDVDALLVNNKNVMCVLPTGAGKSLTLAHYAKRAYINGEVCVIFAHRDVLISQLSEALCKMEIHHSFICSDKARRDITNNNLTKYGNSFYSEVSPIIVSSNPTFAARLKNDRIPSSFLNRVSWWIQDECHHCLAESQLWGSCIKSLPNARGLGFTATPIRGDKKGLGEHTDGFFNALSNTTSMWDLIKAGMLSAYKVFIPPVNIDLSGINVTSSGDYNQKKLVGRVDKREITGDAVQHYLKVSPGQPAITFCVNIEHAKHVAAEFNNAGIPSKAVSSKCPLPDREKTMRDFAEGKILNLVNVDLLSEGYDSPSITTVLMLRPTQSYSLFKQQFGRMLRPAEGKVYGVLLDFVGNVRFMMEQYNLEHIHDDPEWTLDRGTKRAKSGDGKALEKTTICSECAAFYLVSEHGDTCPECGHTETAAEKENNRRQIQQKDGELVELSVDIVEEIIRKRDQEVLLPMEQFSRKVAMLPAKYAAMNNHAKRLHAHTVLRDKIQKWCVKTAQETGWTIDTVQREFAVQFGVNIFKAQVLSYTDAENLSQRIQL